MAFSFGWRKDMSPHVWAFFLLFLACTWMNLVSSFNTFEKLSTLLVGERER
jgi:hypothetical protein